MPLIASVERLGAAQERCRMRTAAFNQAGRPSRPAMAAAIIIGFMLVATLGLWAYYGTTVFYEMILAGLAACF